MTDAREADEREIRLLIDSLDFDVVDVSLVSPVMSAGPLLSVRVGLLEKFCQKRLLRD
jgi:hypothetical protein